MRIEQYRTQSYRDKQFKLLLTRLMISASRAAATNRSLCRRRRNSAIKHSIA